MYFGVGLGRKEQRINIGNIHSTSVVVDPGLFSWTRTTISAQIRILSRNCAFTDKK